MEINFKLTEDFIKNLPEEDYEVFERLQDGEPFRLYKMKPLMAKAMVDDKGNKIPYVKAFVILSKAKMSEYEQITKAFTDGLLDATVPKVNGDLSNSPSEVPTPASESLDGLE